MRSFMRRAFLLSSAAVLAIDPVRSFAQAAPAPDAPATQPSTQPTTRAAFNFQNAPLTSVLTYMSDTWGFTIIAQVPITGRVQIVIGQKPIDNRQDALDLFESILQTNGYAAIVQANIIKINSASAIKKEGIPVYYGTDPASIPDTDEMRTQIMQVKTVDAVRLRTDLVPLVDTDADLTSNPGSNSIIITDTSSRIRRIAKIIFTLDQRDQAQNGIKEYQLHYADAQSTATLLLAIFKPPDQQQQAGGGGNGAGGGGGGGRGGGGGGRGGGGFGFAGLGGAAAGGAGGGAGTLASSPVEAAADERTNTVVVTGPLAILTQVDEVVKQLDNNPAGEETFFLYRVKNGQAADMQATLNALFSGQGGSSGGNRNTGSNALGARGGATLGGGGAAGGRGGAGGGLGGGGGRGGGGGLGGGGGGGFGGGGGGRGGAAGGFTAAAGGRGGGGGFGGGAGGGGSASALSGVASLIGQVIVVADGDTNSLLVATATKFQQQVKDVIAELDRPVPQVLIKALIAEVTHNNGDQIGVDFSILNQRITPAFTTGTVTQTQTINGTLTTLSTVNTQSGTLATKGSIGGQALAGASPAIPGGIFYTLMEDNVTAQIQALETSGKLDVLSRPYILTSDNQEATIVVGEEDPFVSETRTDTNGNPVNTIQYQEVGVILDVTPHVNPDGLVTMIVNPQVSQREPGGVTITTGVVSPIFSTRTASAEVAVRDSDTIVIGGMMQDTTTQTVNKVPLLGDLPLIGALFQNNQTNKQKTELLFFLTPHVAQIPEKLQGMTNEEMKNLQIVPNAVQPGVFQQSLRDMERGGDPNHSPELLIPAATTKPSGVLGEPPLPNGKNGN